MNNACNTNAYMCLQKEMQTRAHTNSGLADCVSQARSLFVVVPITCHRTSTTKQIRKKNNARRDSNKAAPTLVLNSK